MLCPARIVRQEKHRPPLVQSFRPFVKIALQVNIQVQENQDVEIVHREKLRKKMDCRYARRALIDLYHILQPEERNVFIAWGFQFVVVAVLVALKQARVCYAIKILTLVGEGCLAKRAI